MAECGAPHGSVSLTRRRRTRSGLLIGTFGVPGTHIRGVPWAVIGAQVGQSNLAVTANTYSHVLIDETEVDYAP
jgi:hypothetical protein